MQDYKKLAVWEKSHAVALNVYKASMSFPKEELFGLVSQMRRAAVSIPSNIAEGCGRDGSAELARFLQIALGSASELEYQTLLAHDLGFLDPVIYQKLDGDIVQIKKMLIAFILKLRK